jgi:hypothetical protein
MKGRQLTDVQISLALRAHLPERAQAGLRERIMEAANATTQQRPFPSFLVRASAIPGLQHWTGRVRTNRLAWLLVAAALLALLAASAIFVGSQRPALLSIQPTPTPKAEASSQAVELSPSPAIQNLELTWRKVTLDGNSPRVAWLGDRFVMVNGDSGGVSTSTDGASWHVLQPGDPDPGYFDLLRGSFASWQNDVVGWWNPEDGPDIAGKPPVTARDVLRIVRPPAEPRVTTPFKGRIESIGIGPAGIVAQVHSHLDWDAWVASKLGADWVSRYKGVDFKDGILEITMKKGRGLKVVWADQGFEPGDYMDAGFGWYSPDGEHWTLMPAEPPSPDGDGTRGFLTGFGDVVGVSDGFIARGIDTECSSPDGCAGMWHSSDGLTWRNVGNMPKGSEGQMLPWTGGALVTDGVGRFDFWTSQGHTELPMAAKIRAAWKQPKAGFGTGPLGLVTVLKDDKEILVTRDGGDWDIQPMPAEMAADSTLFYGTPSVTVGDRSVLVVMWSGKQEARIPSLWLGTPEP